MQRKHTSSLLRVLSLYVIAIVSLAQRDVPPGVLQPPAADLAKLADSRQNNQESSQPTQPIYIAPASLAEAETAINWTQYHLNPKFVNGPACPLANNTLGWKTLRNPDGSFVTQSKRPIRLIVENWDSYALNSYLAQYLLEAMGYRVEVVAITPGYIIGSELYANAVDLELEIWPEDTASYIQMTQVDRIAVDMGATGYSGIIGLYVPTPLVSKYPALGFDFWRFLLNREARSLFPKSGTGPHVVSGGKPSCDDQPFTCMNGSYTPPQCQLPGSDCIELWAFGSDYSPDNFQRIIDSLNLNLTINFLGYGAQSIMQKALDNGENVFVYNWAPSAFVAANNLTKVLFPATDSAQYVALAADRKHAVVTTDVPTIIIHKLATQKFVQDFPELVPFVNAYQILDATMNTMLKSTVMKGYNYSTAACKWMLANQDVWETWIPKPPTSVVDCPIGHGRYLTGIVFTCINCPPGTYNWMPNNNGTCTTCPADLDCPGGPVVHVTNGLWMANLTNTTMSRPLDYYKCPIPTTCCSTGSCPPGACTDTFSGILCTECAEPGAYMWNNKCVKCGNAGGTSFWGILFGAFFGAAILLYLPYEEAPTVEILFFYFQVTYYIFENEVNGILSLPGLSTFLAIASLNIDGMVADCTLPIAGVGKLVFRYFLPLLIMFYIVLIYIVMRFLQSSGIVTASSAGKLTPYYMHGQPLSLICFRAMIVVLTFVVMPLVDASLVLLQCNTVEGKYVLFKAPSVQCFSGAHSGAAAFAIIMLILLLGVLPLTLYFILSRLHKSDNITYEHDGITNIQKLFQCLYIVFKPEFYWFMPITMIEKGVTSILFTLLIKYDEKTQVNVYILFLAFLCAMRIYWQPYYSHLEAYLNREISLGILVMIAFRQYTSQNGVSTGTIAQVGIIVFLPVVMHAIRWISANYVKHQDIILEQTGKFTSKMGGSGSMIKSKSHSNSNAGIKNLNRSESKGFGGNTQMRRSVEKLVVGGSTSGSVGKSKQGLSRQTSSKLSVHDKAAGNGLCAIMSPISGTARGSIIKKQEEQQPLNTTPAP